MTPRTLRVIQFTIVGFVVGAMVGLASMAAVRSAELAATLVGIR